MPGKKNYDSDTLSQQRKAREEFLELKRIQSGAQKAPPPPSADAVLPETIKDKSQNFWFYNKWIVIGAIFLAAVITITVAQCASRVNYDLKVTLYTAKLVTTQDAELISEYLKKYCDDVNGDGEVNVQVLNCSYDANGNRQLAQTSNAKIQAIIVAEPKCVLFITDDITKQRLYSIPTTSDLFDGDYVKLGSGFYTACQTSDSYTLPENLVLYKRHKSSKQLKQDDEVAACYRAAQKMLARMSAEQ